MMKPFCEYSANGEDRLMLLISVSILRHGRAQTAGNGADSDEFGRGFRLMSAT
jgi:hypothetical protein